MSSSSARAARVARAAQATGQDPNSLPAYKCGHYGHVSKRTHKLCGQNVVTGTEHCPHHAGKSLEQHRAEGQIRVEAAKLATDGKASPWTLDGHDGSMIDPKVEILRMVAFWKWKANKYGSLLEEAYVAADRLRKATRRTGAPPDPLDDVNGIVELREPEWDEDGDGNPIGEHPALQTARKDLERIFAQGGVTALIGHKYDVDRLGRVFAVDEGIRGLVTLEERAHTMLAKCINLAVQAKVAESRIQLAEQVGVMIQAVILGVLRDLSIAADDRVMHLIAMHIDQVAGTPALTAA